jgi:hypothetical protein
LTRKTQFISIFRPDQLLGWFGQITNEVGGIIREQEPHRWLTEYLLSDITRIRETGLTARVSFDLPKKSGDWRIADAQ